MLNNSNFNYKKYAEKQKNKLLFVIFCLWTFVLLCRPQDIFPVLTILRPALLAGVLTLSVAFMQGLFFKGFSLFSERQVKLYVFLLGIMIVGIPFSLYSRVSFMTIFTIYINVILYFFLFYKIVNSVDRLYLVLLVACLGNGLYSAVAVVRGGVNSGRLLFGEMFDPNDLAFFSLCFLSINLIFISRDNPFWVRISCIVSFVVGIFLIILTGSRGGMLSLSGVLFLLMIRKSVVIGRLLKVVLIGFVLFFVSLFPINYERFQTIFEPSQDYNVSSEDGRINVWKRGMKIMFANPLTGVGVDCFGEAIGRDREAEGALIRTWQAPHNMFVQIGTETGVLGFVIYLFMTYNVLIILNKSRKAPDCLKMNKIGEMGFIGFIGLVISGFFLSQAYSLYWAFYVALSSVINQILTTGSFIHNVSNCKKNVKN